LTGFQKRIIEGVAPVDGQEELLEQAVAEHSKNYSVHNFTLGVTYRDDAAPSGLSLARMSPFAKSGIAASGVPIYSYSGWYDGAYHRAAIARFLSYQTPGSRVIIGPWDHGGRQNISPHHPPGTPVFDQVSELIRFFDFHLKGSNNGFGKEKPIRYYTMGEEAWKEAETWPVPGTEFHTLYFAPERALSSAAPVGDAAQDEYKVDLTATTGTGSRWRSYFNTTRAKIGYPDRAEADKKLLVYDSAPLSGDMKITGHPALYLWVSSSALDGQFFAYLEEISPDGKVTHITEGQLRALHRKVSDAVPPYWQPRPFHSFLRADGQPLTPGEPAEISFALLPTSYLVRKGHSLRIALAGADIDQFAPLPGEAPVWRVYRDSARASRIVLPVIPAQR
jgi:putative CocE/NonD family hydrolase